MIKETEGIVLRNVKYGDSSIVSTLYTRVFGLQSYLIQGIRSEKKTAMKANLFQVGNVLELQVYHAPNKNLQRIKESRMHFWYQQIHRDIVKNSLLLFCIELFGKTVTQPETNDELFEFLLDSLQYIDQEETTNLANFHLYFSLQLAKQMGFGIHDQYALQTPVLDLVNGHFVPPTHQHSLEFVEGRYAEVISQINQGSLQELKAIALNREQRNDIIHLLIRYLQLHVQSMGKIKSLEVLPDLLS